MRGFLLDTNVISEYSRAKPPDERVRKWVDAQDEQSLCLSVLALGEIRRGASLLSPGNKRNQLEAWLEIELPLRFENRVLPIDGTIAEFWGAMAAKARLRGMTLGVIDGLVAATAKHHELVVVTRNVKDFTVWEAPIVNPWME